MFSNTDEKTYDENYINNDPLFINFKYFHNILIGVIWLGAFWKLQFDYYVFL